MVIKNNFGLRTADCNRFPFPLREELLKPNISVEEIKMQQLKEIWKPIKDYEGLYEISNYGRVKSLKRAWTGYLGATHSKKQAIKKKRISRFGYERLALSKDSHKSHHTIHTLVWDHFGDKPRKGRELQVDHIDDNKLNNRIDNLQLLTARENTSKYYRTKNKSSKYIGVDWNIRDNKWYSRITINGKRKHLGVFDSEDDAHLAYQEALLGIKNDI